MVRGKQSIQYTAALACAVSSILLRKIWAVQVYVAVATTNAASIVHRCRGDLGLGGDGFSYRGPLSLTWQFYHQPQSI